MRTREWALTQCTPTFPCNGGWGGWRACRCHCFWSGVHNNFLQPSGVDHCNRTVFKLQQAPTLLLPTHTQGDFSFFLFFFFSFFLSPRSVKYDTTRLLIKGSGKVSKERTESDEGEGCQTGEMRKGQKYKKKNKNSIKGWEGVVSA